ncbi:cadherin-related tumor suppressor-like [Elysia marginata]|uniref:Cadherin-related tumor suppressor-like n=1 Tax=Elysia marginata TaxID=1093978 RepID=A0AAV4HIS6_9GAST|nr:cadherin-related tumor suppressor-like [Elysia marginata]
MSEELARCKRDHSLYLHSVSTSERSWLYMTKCRQSRTQGLPQQSGTGTVTLFVKDVNDHSPVFESSGPYLARVTENQAPGTVVVTVSATDMDQGDNSQIIYSLEDSIDHRFTVHPTSGKVTTTVQLDRELEASYDLVVFATDQGIPPRSASVELRVIVEDDNDHAPEFGTSSYTATMYDSSNTADFVVGVTAVDQDSGNNGKVHYTLEGPDKTFFHINSATGVITHAGRLALMQKPRTTFTFTVRASDLGANPLNSTASVVVTLSSASTADRPSFSDFPDHRVDENAPVGTPVTTVRALSSTGSGVTYHVAGGNVNNAFSVNADTGSIIVANRIDYEVTNMFELWLEARDKGGTHLSTFQKLMIPVVDKNDNSPIFVQNIFTKELEENCPQGTPVIKVMATDQDSGSNQQLAYSIKSGNTKDTFTINRTTGLITTLSATVDRETIATYTLEVMAVDLGQPANTATATVRVTILDQNDNQPKFIGPRSVAVPEDLPLGALVMKLHTQDQDIGENARAHFSLEGSSPGAAGVSHPFVINELTGEITTRAPLDAEITERYSLLVTVEDDSFSQKTSVAIRILDVNDNAPSFQNPVLVFNFAELKPPGQVVGELLAQDLDLSSPNNRYFFSLRRPSSLFELDSESGEIVALETMRFYGGQSASGTMNDHILDVVVTDLGIPSLSSEATVIVRVTDANDHRPVFENNLYFSAVPSNLTVGEDILQVRAVDDKDYGRNAEITYRLTGGNGIVFFNINSTTGVISPKISLVSQLNKKFLLTVTGEDRGIPSQSSQCQVELEITPENLNPPRFNLNPFVKQVREDAVKGFLVDTITATDDDNGINGEIRFYITNGNTDELFSIGEDNGQLTVEGELDYEMQKSYTITITARDRGLHYKEVSKDFTINLRDVNDNKPVFGQDYYDGYIRENSPGQTSIITLTATDDDTEPQNTQVHYSIVTSGGGDPETRSKFQINERTGEIRSTSSAMFDYETRTQYTILVMAFNPSTVSPSDVLKSVTTVYIHVEGENEYQPQFARKAYSFTVSESAAAGFSIGEVKAQDSDGGVDGIVYYYLEGESNLKGFSVEPTTGVLRVASRPDYEASPTLTLTVIAKNWGSIRGNDTDSCTVTISINDANDPPEFTQQLYLASIPENSGGYTLVTFVHAEDRDTRPENREFSYEILSGNDLGKFQVSVSGGKIETTGLGVLDRETMSSYTLVVGARDKTDPSILGSATVSIQLTDMNDNGPRFSPENLEVNVPENETAGYEVIVLKDHTTDDDSPPNQGPYRYRLLDSSLSSYFQVELTTGRVTTKRVLNRETNPQFTVSLTVTDHGEPPKTSTLSFTVLVNDINNSQPKPRPLTIQLAVLQGSDASDMGVIANVQPLDSDLTGIFTCVLLSGDTSDFTIKNACDLEALGPLTRDIYNLRVSGSDEKYSPVEYDVTIHVETLTQGDLASSVAVVLRNERASTFLELKLDSFISAVEEAFGASPFTCSVYGLHQEGADLHVMLYVRDNSDRLLGTADVRRGLTEARSAIETASGVSIANVAASKCNRAGSTSSTSGATNEPPCLNTGTCSTVVVPAAAGGTQVADSASLVMTSPRTELSAACLCPAQFTGSRCEQRQDPCGQTYCDNGQVCGSGNICRCPDGWQGELCRTVDACLKGTLCENGGTCTPLYADSSSSPTGFQCQCPSGHHGRYCDLSDFCREAPCSEHSTCEELSDGFQCRCHYGYHGPYCQLLSTSFADGSYASFSPVNNYHVFNVTLYFATVADQGLLLYSPVAVASRGRGSGFVAVEVVDGRARVSFLLDAENERITLNTNAIVSNGHWRRLEFTKTLKTATLVLQKCEASVCEPCTSRDRSCYHQATFDSGSPQVSGQYINLGGVSPAQFEADLLPHHAGMVSTHDFVGCMHSVSINGQAVDATPTLTSNSAQTGSGVSRPVEARGVSEGCPRTSAADLCWAGRDSAPMIVGDGETPSSDSGVCYNGGTCVDEWTRATCMCAGEYMDDHCRVAKQPFTLGSNAVVKYTLNPNYVRDTKLAAAAATATRAGGVSGRRRRRAALDGTDSATSSVMIRFRATVDQGVLFVSRTEKATCLLWFSKQNVHFLLKTSDAVTDPLSLSAPGISDGEWHNVTVRASLTSYVLDLDGKASKRRDFGTAYDFDSLNIVEMAISGEATVPPNNERVPGLDGCLSQFLLNDSPLPLNGSGSDKYIISAQGSVGGGCGALCAGNPCGSGNTCLVEGETYSCLLVAEGDAGLETGIIVVIVFFVIILIIIVAVFVLFRTRRDLFHKCVRTKKQSRDGVGMGSLAGSSAGGSSHSSNGKVNVNIHENIVPGLNGSVNHRYPLNASEEEAIIRNHIAESLNSAAHKSNSLSDRPDLIGGSSGYSTNTPQPLHLSDGTVILEGGGDLMMGGGVGGDEDIPEHYDFENASSIAPSDIAPSDMIRHYRDFRNNGGVHHHHHHHHQKQHHHHHHQQPIPPPPLNNHLFNKYRENSPPAHLVPGYRSSPGPGIPHPVGPGHMHPHLHHTRQSPVSITGSALSVPAAVPERNHTVGGRPSSAQAAVNLSDGSRSRTSPLTQLNVVRNPRSPHNHRHHQHNYSSNSISPTNQNNNHHHHHHHHDNSRSDSTQSIGSHHSHSSSSSATGVPHHNAHPPSYPHMNPTIQSRPLPPIKAPRGVSNGILPKGLTVEDVNRLNARPDLTDPISVMDAVSSSLDNTGRPRAGAHGGPGPKHHLLASHQHHIMAAHDPVLDSSLLLDPPDSSSDDSGANDSFTCSEFEYDNTNNDLATRMIRDRDPGKLIFSKVAEEVENEVDDHQPNLHHPANNQNSELTIGPHSDGLNSNGDSFTSTNVSSSGSPASQTQEESGGRLQCSPSSAIGAGIPGSLPSPYDFDTLLNWGPNFDKLVGVFRDIAQLPDSGGEKVEGSPDHDYEEYV